MGTQFALPFHLDGQGRIARVDQASAIGRRDQVAHLLLTRPGEREMAVLRSFGVPDPRFVGYDPSAITTAVAANLPNIPIPSVTATDNGDGTQRVTVDVR